MSRNNKVLVVEDDATIQLSIRILLESEGYSVSQARTGSEALELLRDPAQYPALILLDLMLLEVSGQEVLEKLKASEELRSIPTVIMSAAAEALHIAQKYGKPLLSKPLGIDDLLGVVTRYCAYQE